MNPHPELLGMVGRLAGDYCPRLPSTDIVTVAQSAFTKRGQRPIHEVEASVRHTSTNDALDVDHPPVRQGFRS